MPWTAALQAPLSSTISWSLLKFMSVEFVMPSNYLILCHPLIVLPSIFPSMRIFSNELAVRISWPGYWSFGFTISPSNEYSGWFHLKLSGLISLQSKGLSRVFPAPQFKSINSLVLRLYDPTLTSARDTGKTIALTAWTLLVKWCLCRLIRCLRLAWLFFKEQASFGVTAALTVHSDSGAQESNVCHCFHLLLSAMK